MQFFSGISTLNLEVKNGFFLMLMRLQHSNQRNQTGYICLEIVTPPPLSKHGQGQKNNGHTGSSCLDKPVLAPDAQHKKTRHI